MGCCCSSADKKADKVINSFAPTPFSNLQNNIGRLVKIVGYINHTGTCQMAPFTEQLCVMYKARLTYSRMKEELVTDEEGNQHMEERHDTGLVCDEMLCCNFVVTDNKGGKVFVNCQKELAIQQHGGNKNGWQTYDSAKDDYINNIQDGYRFNEGELKDEDPPIKSSWFTPDHIDQVQHEGCRRYLQRNQVQIGDNAFFGGIPFEFDHPRRFELDDLHWYETQYCLGECVALLGMLVQDAEGNFTLEPVGDKEVPLSIEAESMDPPIKIEGDLKKVSKMVQITDSAAVAKQGCEYSPAGEMQAFGCKRVDPPPNVYYGVAGAGAEAPYVPGQSVQAYKPGQQAMAYTPGQPTGNRV